MRVLHLSGDSTGGAARAALRLHKALVSICEADSSMIVRQRTNDDWRIHVANESRIGRFYLSATPFLDGLPVKLQHSFHVVPRSAAWIHAVTANKINRSAADVIHLHWICAGLLSIEEIGKITKPVVWTMHDMWPFCGAEHLTEVADEARWRVGYTQNSRPPQDRWLDIDRWVWRRKLRAWRRPMHMVAPSRWLGECARSSTLMRNWEITVVPNVLDTHRYKPIQKQFARETLGLPLKGKIILFGAIYGIQLAYKGWDLLQPALIEVAKRVPDVQTVIFGQGEPKNPPPLGMPLYWMGHLHDDATLALLYSAADVVVVPSRQESFGQTGSEAHACGCPVVAFNSTGLRDVVEDGVTGYLAEPYSSDDLVKGIEWVLEDDERHARLSAQARERAMRLWSYEAVVPQYVEVYRSALAQRESSI